MSAGNKRLFIVEDQRLIAADLENTLRKLGYEVVGHAVSGEEAIALATAARPDLVLMDIRLEGAMDGIEAASAIRQRLDVPIVYLTAYADRETVERARLTGPFGFVVKPFNERELRAIVEIALYKHETDRLLSEERARRAIAEEFRIIVENVGDHAIYGLDPAGNVRTWNAGAARIEGFEASEVLGTPFSRGFDASVLASGADVAALRQAAETGRGEVEGWRVRKDGRRYWAQVVVTALDEPECGGLRGFIVVARDETRRKAREDARDFLDRATVVLASSLDVDETLRAATRLSIETLADWCIIDLADDRGRLAQAAAAHVDPDKQALAARLGRERLPEAGLRHGAQYVFRTGESDLHPDVGDPRRAAELLGTEHPERLRELGVLSYLCVPLRFQGRVQGVLNLLRGEPPRRFDGADLEVAQELARRVGLAVDNARLYAEAQRAIQARDEFLQIASHELKTPLTPLQFQLDALKRALGKAGIDSERLNDALEIANRQIGRLTRLVETLLDVARISGGPFLLDVTEFDLVALVREVAERFRETAGEGGSTITVQGPPSALGQWDRLRLDLLLTNLLSNALKYGARKPIEVRVEARADQVTLAVRDHGVGIEPEALPRIFERFERAGSIWHYGGLGLGLFIARTIVEAHGGAITAQSQPGQGATFTVTLPRVVPPDPF